MQQDTHVMQQDTRVMQQDTCYEAGHTCYAAGHVLCSRTHMLRSGTQGYTRTQAAQVGTAEHWETLLDPEDAVCTLMLFIRLNSVLF